MSEVMNVGVMNVGQSHCGYHRLPLTGLNDSVYMLQLIWILDTQLV